MDLANLKAIEMTSKQYKEIHNISNEQIKEDKKISIRDYMSKDELEKIKKAEEHINGFIKYGEIFSYQILKEKLFKL
jgi:Ser-tRNA(Ala) deacylase AlaX